MLPSLSLFGHAFSTWRFVVVCAVVLCWFLVLRRTRRLGYPVEPVLVFLVLEMPVGLLGGMLFNRLIPFAFGLKGTELDGLTVIGSMVVTIAFGLVYIERVLKTPPLPLFDAVAFTMPLAIGIGRFGCLLNGCCFGTVPPAWVKDSVLRLFTIRVGSYSPFSYAGQVLKAAPGAEVLWNLPLMLMLHELAVLVVVETLYRNRARWRLPAGAVLAAAALQEEGGRFFLEFLRWDEHVGATRFNPWQLSTGAVAVFAAAWLAVSWSRRGRAA